MSSKHVRVSIVRCLGSSRNAPSRALRDEPKQRLRRRLELIMILPEEVVCSVMHSLYLFLPGVLDRSNRFVIIFNGFGFYHNP